MYQNSCIFVQVKTITNHLKFKAMSTEIMKARTEKEITNMGYSIEEAKRLIDKYWGQVDYLKTAREKALYITTL